jgi:hypothetical protein
LSPNAWDQGPSYTERPNQAPRIGYSNDKTIVASIYNRLSVDATSVEIRHVEVDEEERYVKDIDSSLNYCLKVEANIDQAADAFMQDVYLSLFEEGDIAIVPVDATLDPEQTMAFDVQSMRVGRVEEFKPGYVKVSVFNEQKGFRESKWWKKKSTPIVHNPFFTVMNEQSSTMHRLSRKLRLLDTVDEASASGKLDMIIQLPYVVRSEDREKQAAKRREDIAFQLKDSQYGVAYADASEKITQLNRPVENQLLAQVQYLIEMVYTQLGLTPEIMNGTAEEAAMLNYFNRTISPIVKAVRQAMQRAFLSKTAWAQGQRIESFLDMSPFVTMKDWAEISDKFTRSELASSNELRSKMGWKPSKDPKADELRNTNMPRQATEPGGDEEAVPEDDPAATLDAEFDEEITSLAQSGVLSAEDFAFNFLAHKYDADYQKRYYEEHKKLKGRKKGEADFDKNPPKTRRARVSAIANREADKLGPQRAAAIKKLADDARSQLETLTETFRAWVDAHPKVSDAERWAKRDEMLAKKDQIVKKLKEDVTKFESNTKKTTTAPEGRHH